MWDLGTATGRQGGRQLRFKASSDVGSLRQPEECTHQPAANMCSPLNQGRGGQRVSSLCPQGSGCPCIVATPSLLRARVSDVHAMVSGEASSLLSALLGSPHPSCPVGRWRQCLCHWPLTALVHRSPVCSGQDPGICGHTISPAARVANSLIKECVYEI